MQYRYIQPKCVRVRRVGNCRDLKKVFCDFFWGVMVEYGIGAYDVKSMNLNGVFFLLFFFFFGNAIGSRVVEPCEGFLGLRSWGCGGGGGGGDML